MIYAAENAAQFTPPLSLSLPPSPIIDAPGGSCVDDCEDSSLPKSSFRKMIPSREKATGAATPSTSFFSAVDKKDRVADQNQRKKFAINAGSPPPLPTTERASSLSTGMIRGPRKRKNARKIVYKSRSENKQQQDHDDATAPTTASSISSSIHGSSIHSSSIHSSISISSIHSTSSTKADDDKKQRRQRVIKFNRKVRIRKIPLRKDIPLEDIEAVYYSNQELVDVRNSLRARVRVLIEINYNNCNGITDGEDIDSRNSDNHADDAVEEVCDFDDFDDDDDSDIFCIRGLEHEFPDGKERRRKNKTSSREAVFEEQKWQRERPRHPCNPGGVNNSNFISYDDPMHAIAEVYRLKSASSLRHAIKVAKLDEIVAKRIYATTDK